MYCYYTLHALGFDIWWKKYLTMLQIVQFVVGSAKCALNHAGLGAERLGSMLLRRVSHMLRVCRTLFWCRLRLL